jgi:hypothetical protein
MDLYPNALLPSDAVLFVIPALESAAGKTAGIDGEIRLDRAERRGALSNYLKRALV